MWLRSYFLWLCTLLVGGAGLFMIATTPRPSDTSSLAEVVPEASRGEQVFWAAGCASCHSAPDAGGEERLVLSGGRAFPSPYGTFYAPNISSDPVAGIGNWSLKEFAAAIRQGITPGGKHYFPALPYTAYARMEDADLVSLFAFMSTLPASDAPNQAHEIGFPFNIRRLIAGWKLLYSGRGWVVEGGLSPEETRGRYLVEALAHCGECHTPRDALGGLKRNAWLSGAPNPSGKGTIPNIAPGGLDWSAADIAYYLKTGFTPEFDSAGGHMAEVVQNLAHLPDDDLAAIAAYLKRVPMVGN
ncbi:MAG: cytochrome c [Rhodobacteraceae bacterium]|nr:cytochrome c [Paracoccaceae bacterium]